MSFGVALIDAFDDRARGAKVPDLYSFPTSTLALEMELDINADSNGRFSFCVLPHPVLSVYTHNPNPSIQSITGGLRTAGNGNLGTPKIFGSLGASQLAVTCESFRVVGCSWKLESLMTPLTCTGKLTLCQLPASDNIAPMNGTATNEDVPLLNAFMSMPALSSEQTTTYATRLGNLPAGIQNSGNYDSSMRQYATGHNVNATDVQVNGIGANLRVLSPKVFDFKESIADVVFEQGGYTNTVPSTNLVRLFGGSTTYQISTTAGTFGTASTSTVDADQFAGTADQLSNGFNPLSTSYLAIGGWSNQYVTGQGYPSNSKVYSLRVAYHLEYIEAFTSAGSSSRRGPIDTNVMSVLLNAHAMLPFYRNIITSNVNVARARLAV